MEFLILMVAGTVLIMPIVAAVLAVKSKRQTEELKVLFEDFELKFRDLNSKVEYLGKITGAAQDSSSSVAASIADQPLGVETTEVDPESSYSAIATMPEESAPMAVEFHEDEDIRVSIEEQVAESVEETDESESAKVSDWDDQPQGDKESISLEETIGMVWFTRIGALIAIVVAAWFFKYMVNNNWIGPWARIGMGALVGLGFLGAGEYFVRRKVAIHPVFVQGVLGLGLAVLFVTSYASFSFYNLIPLTLTFGIIAVLCAFGGALAVYHRSEAILLLSLLAVFLNPVMLSTGQDRPLVLFSYLFVMTTGVLVAGVKRDFKIAGWVAVAGVLLMFIGWYDTFFDPEAAVGVYFELQARWVPLLFGAVFPLQWIAVGIANDKKGQEALALLYYLAGVLTVHAAATALLFDHPLVLGGTLIGLGAASAGLLLWRKLGEFLGVPMAVSFVVLLAVGGDVEKSTVLSMSAVGLALFMFYFGVFIYNAQRIRRLESPLSLVLTGVSGLGAVILLGVLLLPHYPLVFAAFLVGLSLTYLAFGHIVGSGWIQAGIFAVSLIGLLIGVSEGAEAKPGLLIVSSLWFLVYFGFMYFELIVRKRPVSRMRLFVLAGVGLGYLGLWLLCTGSGDDILRSVLAAGSGALYLLIGRKMMMYGQQPDREPAQASENANLFPLGLALTLFTLALAYLFSGPGITVAWAVEGAVLAFLASRVSFRGKAGHVVWLLGALAVFVLVAWRVFAYDMGWTGRMHMLVFDSLGAEGTLLPTPFANTWAITLAIVALCLLFAAKFTSRARHNQVFKVTSILLLICGHGVLLWMAQLQARLLFTVSPPELFAGTPVEELRALASQWKALVLAQKNQLSMIITVVFGIYSAILLSLGFLFKSQGYRLLGISLVFITLGKLGLYDIWKLETLHKIIIGASIAAVLLLFGYLYARFGKRIRQLLSASDKVIVWGIVLLGSAALPSVAEALEVSEYEQTASLEEIVVADDYRFEIPLSLYAASLSQPRFADLRIVDITGAQIPYVIRRVSPGKPWVAAQGELLNPVRLEDGSFQVVVNLGKEAPVHTRLNLSIAGTDYLRKARVESSLDGETFGVLVDGAYVFDIETGGPRSRRQWIDYPQTHGHLMRVTILPGDDEQQLRITAASVRDASEQLKPTSKEVVLGVGTVVDNKEKETIIELDELPKGANISALKLSIDARDFSRRVVVEASTTKQAWFDVGGTLIYRVPQVGDRGAFVDESLQIDVHPGERRFLRLRIANKDDPSLEVQTVKAIFRLEEVVVRAREPGKYRVLIGKAKDTAPKYDFESQLRQSAYRELPSIFAGPVFANPQFEPEIPESEPVPFTDKFNWLLQLFIGLVVLGLAVWTIRLIRAQR